MIGRHPVAAASACPASERCSDTGRKACRGRGGKARSLPADPSVRLSPQQQGPRARGALGILLRAKVATTPHLTTLVYHRRQTTQLGLMRSGRQASSNAPPFYRSLAVHHSSPVSPSWTRTPRLPTLQARGSWHSAASRPSRPPRGVRPGSSRRPRSHRYPLATLVRARHERPLHRGRHSRCAARAPTRHRRSDVGAGGAVPRPLVDQCRRTGPGYPQPAVGSEEWLRLMGSGAGEHFLRVFDTSR